MLPRSPSSIRVLFIEADGSAGRSIELYLHGLAGQGVTLRTVGKADDLRACLREVWDAILVDLDQSNEAQTELLKVAEPLIAHLPTIKLGPHSDHLITSGAETSLDETLARIPVGAAPLFRSVGHLLERRRLERRVEELEMRVAEAAQVDALTGLSNESHFGQRLAHEFNLSHRYKLPLSLCLFEIAGFASINESYGFEIANQVLRACGQLVKESIRNTDLAARLSTDQFCIVFPNTSLASAMIGIERIRDALAHKIFLGKSHENFTVDASYGAVQLDEHHAQLDALLLATRQVLQTAKDVGPGHIEIASPATMAR